MGWLVALGIITLLAVLPLGVSVSYDSDGAVVKVIIGPLKITLFPRPKKEKKPGKDRKPKTDKKKTDKPVPEPAKEKAAAQTAEAPPAQDGQPEKPGTPKKKTGGPITDFLPLVKVVLQMLGTFRRRLRVNVLNIKLIMAGDDPCDLAVNYGRAWAAVGNLQPQLERVFVIKKRNIEVECDFTATEMLIDARLDLTITLGRLLATVVVYGVRALMEFMKIKNKRKGGAAK